MKKFVIILLTSLLIIGLCSCDPYADQISKMQNEINSLKERVERNEESIDILIANTDTEVARLRDYIENVSIISDGQNEEVLEKIESLETVLDTLKKNTDASDEDRIAEIEALEDELETLKTKVTSIDSRVTTLEELSAKVSDITELASRLKDLEDNSKEKDKTITSIKNGLTNLNSKLDVVSDNYNTAWQNMWKKVSDLESTLKATIEEDEETLSLLEEVVAKINSRVGTKFHLNPTTGELEPHTCEFEIHEDYHLYKCTVCGYCETGNLYAGSNVHSWETSCNKDTHTIYCEVCGYKKVDNEPHTYDYPFGEEDWYADYPTTLNVEGAIEPFGGYGIISFKDIKDGDGNVVAEGLPNYYRSVDGINCIYCENEIHKISNHGNGSVAYYLSYSPYRDIEKYVTETGEYMLRLEDRGNNHREGEGKVYNQVLYLRNYYVIREVTVGGIPITFKWEVKDGKLNYYMNGVLDEERSNKEMTGSTPLSDFIGEGWDGATPWSNSNGYRVGGDVYFMGFGTVDEESQYWYTSSKHTCFKVIDGQFVEVNYLDIEHTDSKPL